jgi:cell wall-associated NlpC family hydrolase
MNKRLQCLILAVVLLFGSGMSALAASVNEVQKQQTETKNRLNEINKSITAIESKRKEVQAQLKGLNADLVETMLTLETLETDIEIKQDEINIAQEELERLQKLEEEQYEAMKLRIQYMYEKGSTDYISMFLEAKSVTELLNRVDFANDVSDYDDVKLKEYQETKDMVAETKAVLEEEQAELEEVQEAQLVYKAELDKKISAAKSKKSNFESELAKAQKQAEAYKNTIKEQTALIKKLEAEEARKAAEEAAKNNKESLIGGSSSSSSSGSSSSGNSSVNVSGSGLGAQIASYALKFVGNPYVSGGTSLTNGADCSGFTWAVHRAFGISIPRISRDQAKSGKSVSISNVQAGDIIYYGDHVGIYIGNGQIVHASTKATGIKISNYTYRPPLCVRRYW